MAGVTLDKLPPALALSGAELFWIYQPGPTEVTPYIGLRCTLDQILARLANTVTSTTMRQLLGALSFQGVLFPVFEALPSDINNSYNIAWNHAASVTLGDPFVTGFLQPTLGYTNQQMGALFALAQTLPVGTGNSVTMRQLVAALGSVNQLVSVYENLPSDITSTYNIAWYHAFTMTLTDPFTTGFLQPTLGYSGPQMAALFNLALSFPP